MSQSTKNEDEAKCARCGRKVPFITLAGNLSLGALKIIAGLLSGSVGLTVDGFHSMADGIGTIFVLASLRISEKPRDATHPFGHGKAEFMASMVVFTVLIGVGVLFLVESTAFLIIGRNQAPSMLAFLVAMVSVVANYVMLNFNLCAGKRLNSPALIANGHENLTDLVSSIPVGIGVLAAQFGYFFCDPLAGALVSVFIIVNASREWWHNLNNLMDRAAPLATRKRIHALAVAVDGVSGMGRIRTRRIGGNLWVDLDILVSPRYSVETASRIADEVRGLLLRKAKHIEDVLVYYHANIAGSLQSE
ncbi:MAG: cation diffusion facilitator family transporter [Planctomycetota bacterium]|jgi:cation diffusion facilitator family transporter